MITIDKNITIDLNGKKVTAPNKAFVVSGAEVIFEDKSASEPVLNADGTISYSGGELEAAGNGVVNIENGGKLIFNSGKISAPAGNGVFIVGDEDATTNGTLPSTIDFNGGFITSRESALLVEGRGAILNINGGILEAADNAVVAGNGTSNSKIYRGGTTTNINGGIIVGHTISNGYLGCGVYHPQQGALNIKNADIQVENGIGILMRGGEADISGTEIKTTGTLTGKVGDSKVMNGCYGVCLDFESKYYDGQNMICVIEDSVIDTESESIIAVPVDEENNKKLMVNSGKFSTDPAAFAEGKTVEQTDNFYEVR